MPHKAATNAASTIVPKSRGTGVFISPLLMEEATLPNSGASTPVSISEGRSPFLTHQSMPATSASSKRMSASFTGESTSEWLVCGTARCLPSEYARSGHTRRSQEYRACLSASLPAVSYLPAPSRLDRKCSVDLTRGRAAHENSFSSTSLHRPAYASGWARQNHDINISSISRDLDSQWYSTAATSNSRLASSASSLSDLDLFAYNVTRDTVTIDPRTVSSNSSLGSLQAKQTMLASSCTAAAHAARPAAVAVPPTPPNPPRATTAISNHSGSSASTIKQFRAAAVVGQCSPLQTVPVQQKQQLQPPPPPPRSQAHVLSTAAIMSPAALLQHQQQQQQQAMLAQATYQQQQAMTQPLPILHQQQQHSCHLMSSSSSISCPLLPICTPQQQLAAVSMGIAASSSSSSISCPLPVALSHQQQSLPLLLQHLQLQEMATTAAASAALDTSLAAAPAAGMDYQQLMILSSAACDYEGSSNRCSFEAVRVPDLLLPHQQAMQPVASQAVPVPAIGSTTAAAAAAIGADYMQLKLQQLMAVQQWEAEVKQELTQLLALV